MNTPEECPRCGESGDMRPMRNLSDPDDRTVYGHECGGCGAHVYPGGESNSGADVRSFNARLDAARDRRLFG